VVRTRTGYDARCYRLRADDWNAMGELLCKSSHRTLSAAEKSAARFHKSWGGTLDFSHRGEASP
jgi:hypothetical protein